MNDRVQPGVIITVNRLVTAARLLSGAAHEVNNALQVIAGSVELLEGRHDLPEPAMKSLERIRGQTNRAAGALDAVMQFVRRPADARSRLSLRDLAAQSVALRGFSARRAGLTIRYVPPDGPLIVEGNSSQLQQVMLNLIANAEQALAGRAGATIAVEALSEPPWAVVRVRDEGEGVPPEVQLRLFEPFVSGNGRSDSVGLGLAAAKAVVDAHGGALDLEPTERGASFVLRVPQVREE
jgi:signal transduction histidine kinase